MGRGGGLPVTKPAPARWRFAPRLVPTLATAAGLALFVYLGQWQHGKALLAEAAAVRQAQRLALPPERIGAGLLDPQVAEGARFVVRGQYEAAGQFFIDNRQEGGVPGVHVITPLRIEAGATRLLVNRGWIAWPQGRGVLPQVPVPAGEVQVSGRAQRPSTKPLFLIAERPEPAPQLWNRVDLARYAAASGQVVQPVLLLQDSTDLADGLVRHWAAPEDRSLKHRGYALQWLVIAAGLLVFYAVASLRRPARGAGSAGQAAAAPGGLNPRA